LLSQRVEEKRGGLEGYLMSPTVDGQFDEFFFPGEDGF